jgi:hypothetical protein
MPPAGADSGGRALRIALLVFVGLVVLCGLAGSCLFAITLVVPLITGTPTPGPY